LNPSIVPENGPGLKTCAFFTRRPVVDRHDRRICCSGGIGPGRRSFAVSRDNRRFPSPDIPMQVDTARIEKLTRELLEALGEDPTREGLLKTPERVAKAIAFLTSGYRTDLPAIINNAIFTQTTNSMVIVKNIEVYSLCEHHMLPFFGRCHIGYIPTGRVFGVSKLARLVDMYARRLQLQERLTEQISQAVHDSIDARGVGVMIEAQHLCMMMRGVEKQNSEMVTSSVLGTFRESQATREEFLALIGSRA